MQVRIEDIKIKKRARHNLGELKDLAKSLSEHGLMNPVSITENKVLISGHRRIEAAKLLGWKTIEAIVHPNLSKIELLEMEIDENLHRKDFTSDEIVEAFHQLEHLNNPGFFRKLLNFFKELFLKITGLFRKKS